MTYFPQNPSDGMIWEPEKGVFYIYSDPIRAWSRAEGGLPPLASALNDGLMSSADLKKLNRVVIPPPQSTITSATALATFVGGFIDLMVEDEFLSIEGTAKLMNVAGGVTEALATTVDRELHQRTNSFDFRVDVETLYDYMVETNKLRVIHKQGRRGPPGDAGEDGLDNLPYGPNGLDGERGANAPFDHQLFSDDAEWVKKQSVQRAIVSLATEEVSPDENYIVANRAIIGNPEACPNAINLTSDLPSTWVVCAPVDTSLASLMSKCYTCIDTLYYIDISYIMAAIRAEFEREAQQLKQGMEDIVSFWLTVMSGLFDDQKSALCCALEHCESSKRNAETRQYIETQRIQAAQGNFAIDVSSNPDASAKNVTIMDSACEPNGFGTNNSNHLPNDLDPIGGPPCVPYIMRDADGNPIKYPECPPGFTPRDEYRKWLKSQRATTTATTSTTTTSTTSTTAAPILPLAVSEPVIQTVNILPDKATLHVGYDNLEAYTDLAPGNYKLFIDNCCLEVNGKYSADCEISFNDGLGKKYIPDLNTANLRDAQAAYKYLNVPFSHTGGKVGVKLLSSAITGELDVTILGGSDAEAVEAKLLKQMKEPSEQLFPHEKKILSVESRCRLTADRIRWLERSWKLRDCVGAVVEFNSQDYVIIHKAGLEQFCSEGIEGIAIAWPVINGVFIPTTGGAFLRFDPDLQQKVMGLLGSGKYSSKIGDLRVIKNIAFPLSG